MFLIAPHPLQFKRFQERKHLLYAHASTLNYPTHTHKPYAQRFDTTHFHPERNNCSTRKPELLASLWGFVSRTWQMKITAALHSIRCLECTLTILGHANEKPWHNAIRITRIGVLINNMMKFCRSADKRKLIYVRMRVNDVNALIAHFRTETKSVLF